ncbi:DNA-binding NarL/FixJ family response regulator [Filimonas zeae]|uniref:DNA-binding response regulator n=1 Tax=Filimonas zeae TaxID=1737353 RepID=A0A917J130_9BACT|nr:response regulator transcription factor [Filimonas zeae]MDR6341680.1 DNA-binding NarL/FixJ family response regulator [Filimonas zeae]GGH74681.1 DNA-binding response regulator [Filimonas zeae]
MPYRLIIADDHQLLIDGLSAVLNTNTEWELLPAVNNGRELLYVLEREQVDLVLLDLNMPQLDGVKALSIIKRNYPKIKVLVLTNYGQPQLQAEIRKAGAEGYLLKNSPAALLREVIQLILEGGMHYSEAEETPAEENTWFLDDFMKRYQLTRREVEIIKMIGQELTSKEISDRLYISEFTVSTHRKNILRKLNLKNTAGVVNFARENSLI